MANYKRIYTSVDTKPVTLYQPRTAGAEDAYPALLNAAGQLIVDVSGGNITSATNTKANVTTASTLVLAANTDRIAAIIVNDSDEEIYLSLSGTAVMNEGIRLNPYGGTLNETEYTGIISAICETGTKNLTVCEK